MIARFLTIAAMTLAAAPAVAQMRTTELEAVQDQHQVDKTTQTEDVRFRDDGHDRMTVPVQLSGTGPYRFLVDTGAERTAISRDIAAKLKLASGQATVLHSIAGATSVATANVPSLKVTRKELSVADAPLLDPNYMGADGILGIDSLRSQRVQFNFSDDTLSIVPSASPELDRDPGTIVVRARRRNGRLVLTQATANGRHLNVVLDTGSQISVGNFAMRDQLFGKNRAKLMHEVVLESVTGEKIAGEYAIVHELEIGGVKLNDLAVVFADAHTFDKLDLGRKPALLLGMNAMRAFKRVSIDFGTRKLRVMLPEESALSVALARVALPSRRR